MISTARQPVDLATNRPHSARLYDVLLGGKTNYAADRRAAEQILRHLPGARQMAWTARAFTHRAVRHAVKDGGIRQFLDVGAGIPTSPNLHEVAQRSAPETRVVYVDNDPIVLTHSRALHTSHPDGATAYVQADATAPDTILEAAAVREVLDLNEPVAVMLCLLLHWLPPDNGSRLVKQLMDAVPPGSYLVISHLTADHDRDRVREVAEDLAHAQTPVATRTRAEVGALFAGLDLVEPGVVTPQDWWPDTTVNVGRLRLQGDNDVPLWVGVARKPGPGA
ncbi:SAM-dependent methyltransferase [Streptomyces sp. PTM05]|uniref:SAM-dependent methyltransferase n=2 Tax=Streptantibioticus parmotrematis TaxID=2873249 RepID=A0ABS7R1G0_9ACTN|nr:SAM-dependent methyltransferase [Streptantibioticus parmotrematis]